MNEKRVNEKKVDEKTMKEKEEEELNGMRGDRKVLVEIRRFINKRRWRRRR